MMKYRIAVAAGLLFAAGVAHADSYSVTPTIATDYDFRGESLTDPIEQGRQSRPSSLAAPTTSTTPSYVGAWGSNIDNSYPGAAQRRHTARTATMSRSMFFGGYAWGDASSSFAYDVGLYAYTYPGWNRDNAVEAYAGVYPRHLLGQAVVLRRMYASSSKVVLYAELNANIPMGSVDNLTLVPHVGQCLRRRVQRTRRFLHRQRATTSRSCVSPCGTSDRNKWHAEPCRRPRSARPCPGSCRRTASKALTAP